MSDNTVGSMYLAASERNAQRIADLQAEVERLRAQLAERDEWEPVPDGKYNTLSSTQLETAGDKLYHLFGHGYYAKVAMPDDLRLCRRKAKE